MCVCVCVCVCVTFPNLTKHLSCREDQSGIYNACRAHSVKLYNNKWHCAYYEFTVRGTLPARLRVRARVWN